MLKKVLATSLAATTAIGLTACGPGGSGNQRIDDRTDFHTGVDVNDFSQRVNLGVAVRNGGTTSISNRIDAFDVSFAGANRSFNIAPGAILPSWVAIGNPDMLNINFTDEAGQAGNWNNAGLMTEFNANTISPDLITNGAEALNNLGQVRELVPLNQYWAYMPNFREFLDRNPAVEAQLRHNANNGIFWTPYFDGFEAPDQMFSMNVDFVRALLDRDTNAIGCDWFQGEIDVRRGSSDAWGDTDNAVRNTSTLNQIDGSGNPIEASDGLQDIPNTTISGRTGDLTDPLTVVRQNGEDFEAYTFTRVIEAGYDIFSRTNRLFETTNGVVTGKAFIQMFIDYIDDTYGNWIANTPGRDTSYPIIWQNRSEIFTGVSAVHNADEFITLLRAVRKNPTFLTGNQTTNSNEPDYAVITPFVPRSGNGNRQDAILSLASMWGVRGVRARGTDRWFIDADGILQDGRHQPELLDAIDNIRKLYLEGLIPYRFYTGHQGGDENVNSNDGAAHQFISNRAAHGQIFAIYDFNASQTVFNRGHQMSDDTPEDFRWVTTGLMPVLPPVARWETGLADDQDGDMHRFTHFTEDMRAMRDEGWGLVYDPTRSRHDTIRAITLMDRMFDHLVPDEYVENLRGGDRVSDIINFGPKDGTIFGEQTLYGFRGQQVFNNQTIVGFSDEFISYITGGFTAPGQTANTGWANEMRRISGISLTIGHVRPNATDYLATSAEGQIGLNNLLLAMYHGVLRYVQGAPLGTLESDFFVQVPISFPLTEGQQQSVDNSTAHQNMLTFFDRSGSQPIQFSLVVSRGWAYTPTAVPNRQQLEGMIQTSRTQILPIMRSSFAIVNGRMPTA